MNIAQFEYAIGRGIAAIRGATPTDTTFLRYALIAGLPRLLALTSGSVFPNISVGDLKKFVVPWPAEPIRRASVGVLGTFDEKIESNRRAIHLANDLLDALGERCAADLPFVSLVDLVTVSRTSVNPSNLENLTVDHYSLPAFDQGAWPERVIASSIMSNKLAVEHVSILVSRLNPRINRTWWAAPSEGTPALASTEFSCITADSLEDLAGVWLAVRTDNFVAELARRVTGTSGSHQRIRPDDMLTIEVPDARRLSIESKAQALSLLSLIDARGREIVKLGSLRNILLPELLSGRLRAPLVEDLMLEVVA